MLIKQLSFSIFFISLHFTECNNYRILKLHCFNKSDGFTCQTSKSQDERFSLLSWGLNAESTLWLVTIFSCIAKNCQVPAGSVAPMMMMMMTLMGSNNLKNRQKINSNIELLFPFAISNFPMYINFIKHKFSIYFILFAFLFCILCALFHFTGLNIFYIDNIF